MQIENKPQLTIFEKTILRTNLSEIDHSQSILLLLHGYTGDENSMWLFGHNASPNTLIISPRAPHSSSLGGYSWVNEKSAHNVQQAFSDYLDSANSLKSILDQFFAQNAIVSQDISIVGFSQGAAMSYTLSILYPQWVKKVAALAGFIPNGYEAFLKPEAIRHIDFYIAHGEKDQTVSIDRAIVAHNALEAAGASVKYCTDQSEHKLGASCYRGLGAFLKSN